ncbi:ELKS/Rab6-interacting/CAST family protein [Modicisalibacter tunisiensis]|uniref:Alpha/beta hydrolase n=1 Tax=Modicisalibacter tunisiensis TaxID=390637 RepID=A0ABS7X085_9GAMM|nr:ELKS/Rab6-interacting/CAST family protein [Modicisalibacter tunisiensis]MBZ9538297.1 hypothetical protein [Modicisalibacter tunisiensis]MBZ9568291.1 hypothetical protein [Modicisalibacter tunisiensis]
MHNIFEDDLVKVSISKNPKGMKKKACICFSGVGFSLGGIEIQKEEFKNATESEISIFIIDKKRTWGNSIDLDFIASLLRPYIYEKEVFLLGNSMGGFIAIIFSSIVKAKSCICFSPQFSIDESLVAENRWKNYTRKIEYIKYREINSYFSENTLYYLFFGDHSDEEKHWDKIKTQENIHIFILEQEEHNVARRLKENSLLYKIIENCFFLEKKESIKKLLYLAKT